MKPEDLIRRPDGSYVDLEDVEPRHALAHELVTTLFPMATAAHDQLTRLKRLALDEMSGYREMMLADHGVTVGGKEGNLTLRSLCGRFMIKMTVSKYVTFGPELEAATALIDQFLEQELTKGGSAPIHQIIEREIKVNQKGRLNTAGILGLRQYRFKDPLWNKAMDAIEKAIIRDSSAIYVNFYNVDVSVTPRVETLLPLDFAKVG
ncbi:MAG: DUF3164 family protein [Marinibacterium sp.]|nr:DUF3164 family protein [Marinibacterium sp.]